MPARRASKAVVALQTGPPAEGGGAGGTDRRPCFAPAERVALELVEAVLTPPPAGTERVTGELYARAAEHYDPKALATLTIAIGQVNFFVPLALIGKPVPGVRPAEQWT
ncbi:hypothetical protein [Kitasatospora sp. NPDC050467]|uniref:hypothetical protein n=1 Tax=unclassified Kitasatospora TaxID=2633591 RepID=UPI00379305E8